MYVLIDGVTAGCQAYLHPPASLFPFAPAPPSRHSVPSSFNLVEETMESGSASHQGTILVFKGHAQASFPLSHHLVSLLCPHSSLLPACSVPPPCGFVFILTSPASPCLPHRQNVQRRWFKAPCCFVSFFFFLNMNLSALFSPCNRNSLKSKILLGNVSKANPASYTVWISIWNSYLFFLLSGYSSLMFDIIPPFPLLCSLLICVSRCLLPKLVGCRFLKFFQRGIC